MNYCTRFFIPVLLFFPCAFISKAQVTKIYLPPKDLVKSLRYETDAGLRLTILNIHRDDSCKNCTHAGELFVVNCVVRHRYFNKKHAVIPDSFTYMTIRPPESYDRSRDVIAFLHFFKSSQNTEFGKLHWMADEFGEFQYTKKTESYILKTK